MVKTLVVQVRISQLPWCKRPASDDADPASFPGFSIRLAGASPPDLTLYPTTSLSGL